MTTTISPIAAQIIQGATLGLGLAESLAKDIGPARFARFTAGTKGPINANHPAFVYGHLAIYPAMVAGMLGLDTNNCAAPDGYDGLFQYGVDCQDDPDGSIYPSKDEIMSVFLTGHKWLVDQLAGQGDAALNAPNPNEQMAERFTTIGAMANFMLNAHLMFHLGQVSTWRRCEGLCPVM